MVVLADGLRAQYLNTDGGRPGRVEDATPTALRAIDIDFTGIQFERLRGGVSRFRIDPGIAWGALPRTELSLRLPFVSIRPPARSRLATSSGLAGMAVGVMHALTLETPQMPALSVAGEALLPIGALAAPRTSYVMKLLATKQVGAARVHVNVGGGAYSVRVGDPSFTDGSCRDSTSSAVASGTCNAPPIIVDLPCDRLPASGMRTSIATSSTSFESPTSQFNRACMPYPSPTFAAAAAAGTPTTYGTRWFAGAGIDHAFALQSTLVGADIVVERFVGLYPSADGIAEAGVRYQLAPLAVVDAGMSWRFAGAIRSVSFMFGTTIELAWPFWHRAPKN